MSYFDCSLLKVEFLFLEFFVGHPTKLGRFSFFRNFLNVNCQSILFRKERAVINSCKLIPASHNSNPVMHGASVKMDVALLRLQSRDQCTVGISFSYFETYAFQVQFLHSKRTRCVRITSSTSFSASSN